MKGTLLDPEYMVTDTWYSCQLAKFTKLFGRLDHISRPNDILDILDILGILDILLALTIFLTYHMFLVSSVYFSAIFPIHFTVNACMLILHFHAHSS